MPLARCDVFYQLLCHRYLQLRIFAERDPDGVAQPLGHQGADAHGALDAAVLAESRLGHAQVQREVHVLAVHGRHQAAHRLDHDHDVAGFHADDNVVEILGHKHSQKLHHALNHAGGCVAIARHDAVAQLPWFTPSRTAVWWSRQIWMNGSSVS